MPVINRFNRLTSKEWLPFQKSWFRYESDDRLILDYMRFFCKAESNAAFVYYYGENYGQCQSICHSQHINVTNKMDSNLEYEYAIIDLRPELEKISSVYEYENLLQTLSPTLQFLYENIQDRRFITILSVNKYIEQQYYPFAYDIGYLCSTLFSLKDEKIGCLPINDQSQHSSSQFLPNGRLFYTLNFRKDEKSLGRLSPTDIGSLSKYNATDSSDLQYQNQIPAWYILKPQPRKKHEILHPAKYPEELVILHLDEFSKPNDYVFDPMAGTGSTLVASMHHGRNGIGTELSEFFAKIAYDRCHEITSPIQTDLFDTKNTQSFLLINKDARAILKEDFPSLDYMITSPPYWDMLNMKGAENQAKRIEKGLQTNYSDSVEDLGNISDYQLFIDLLIDIYLNIADIMKSGSHMTIVVKNIKKKGINYPFAWDIVKRLSSTMIVLPETFWCQDDINLAPYGYGNTFVSNTFHQYCLNFRKP